MTDRGVDKYSSEIRNNYFINIYVWHKIKRKLHSDKFISCQIIYYLLDGTYNDIGSNTIFTLEEIRDGTIKYTGNNGKTCEVY